MINLDDVVSAVWSNLYTNTEYLGLIPTIVKGPKRPLTEEGNPITPATTISILTAPIDGETDATWCTVNVQVYAKNTEQGLADMDTLGKASKLIVDIFHKNYRLDFDGLVFKSILVQEPLVGLTSLFDGEHLASVTIRMIVKEDLNFIEDNDDDNNDDPEGGNIDG